jgi:hypothetical protein
MKRSAFLLGILPFFALAALAQDEPPCNCESNQAQVVVCLTEAQMSARVIRIEMQPDRMGNHGNLSGIAVFELMVGKNGHVLKAKVIWGHPLAVPLLVGSLNKWRFRPLQQDGVAWQTCGRLSVNFSIVENESKVEIVRP